MKQSLDNKFAINHKKDNNGDIVTLLSFSTFSGPLLAVDFQRCRIEYIDIFENSQNWGRT